MKVSTFELILHIDYGHNILILYGWKILFSIKLSIQERTN